MLRSKSLGACSANGSNAVHLFPRTAVIVFKFWADQRWKYFCLKHDLTQIRNTDWHRSKCTLTKSIAAALCIVAKRTICWRKWTLPKCVQLFWDVSDLYFKWVSECAQLVPDCFGMFQICCGGHTRLPWASWSQLHHGQNLWKDLKDVHVLSRPRLFLSCLPSLSLSKKLYWSLKQSMIKRQSCGCGCARRGKGQHQRYTHKPTKGARYRDVP